MVCTRERERERAEDRKSGPDDESSCERSSRRRGSEPTWSRIGGGLSRTGRRRDWPVISVTLAGKEALSILTGQREGEREREEEEEGVRARGTGEQKAQAKGEG